MATNGHEGHGRCGATARSGEPCQKPAGWGTDHVGVGCCRFHGGATPNHRKAAQLVIARRAVALYGLPREVDPTVALLEELHRTVGHVAWLGEVVGNLDEGRLTERVGGAGGGFPSTEPTIWLKLYQAERKHLVDVAKTCVAVGIEERQVKLAEETGAIIAQTMRGTLEELGIDPNTERVRKAVRKHLTLVTDDDCNRGPA